jgi:hypothetical protein
VTVKSVDAYDWGKRSPSERICGAALPSMARGTVCSPIEDIVVSFVTQQRLRQAWEDREEG